VGYQVSSQHKGEQVQKMKMGLFSKSAMCLEMVQLTWGGHGEVMLGFCFTRPTSPTLYNLLVGMHGNLIHISMFLLFPLSQLITH